MRCPCSKEQPLGGCSRHATNEATKTANLTEQRISASTASSSSSSSGLPSPEGGRSLSRPLRLPLPLPLSVVVAAMIVAIAMQQQPALAGPVATAAHPNRNGSLWARDLEPLLVVARTDEDSNSNSNSNSRLQKRHSSWREQIARELQRPELVAEAWANPCDGIWMGHNGAEQAKKPVKRILRQLLKDVRLKLKMRPKMAAINTADIRQWSKHKTLYSFLPSLSSNSNVALRRWHRQLQVFVASFVYLERAQMLWDACAQQPESGIHAELQTLKRSARSILCEIEAAINNTATPAPRSIKITQPMVMQRNLRFQSQLGHVFVAPAKPTRRSSGNHNAQLTCPVPEPSMLDLKFAKHKFYAYLHAIQKVLRRATRQPGSMQLSSMSASASASAQSNGSSIAELPLLSASSSQQTEDSGQQQQQQQQQHRSRHGARHRGATTRKPKAGLRRQHAKNP